MYEFTCRLWHLTATASVTKGYTINIISLLACLKKQLKIIGVKMYPIDEQRFQII